MDKGISKLTDKFGAFGNVLNKVFSDLSKHLTAGLLQKFLGIGGQNSGGGGGIFGSIFNSNSSTDTGGVGSHLTGGFGGGASPASGLVGLASKFGGALGIGGAGVASAGVASAGVAGAGVHIGTGSASAGSGAAGSGGVAALLSNPVTIGILGSCNRWICFI